MTEISAAIDANIVVALVDDQDKWHTTAVELRNALIQADAELIYFDCVVNEAISVIGRRTEEQKRADQFAQLLDKLTGTVPIESITWIAQESQRLFSQILEQCRRTRGALNYHDALIALVCQEQDIPYIVSFDRDFDDVPWLERIGSAEQVKLLGESVSENNDDDPVSPLPGPAQVAV